MDSLIPSPARRGGAVFSERVTRSIWLAAVLDMARFGYGRMSMERIAERAGVGKAALYRRWSGKEALVIEAISTIDLEVVVAEDRGSLQADIRDYLGKATRLLRRPLAARILPDLYAEMSRDAALAGVIRQRVFTQKRNSIDALIDRAVSRQELSADVDRDLAFSMIMGPIYWSLTIQRSRLDDRALDRLSAAVAASLASCSISA